MPRSTFNAILQKPHNILIIIKLLINAKSYEIKKVTKLCLKKPTWTCHDEIFAKRHSTESFK